MGEPSRQASDISDSYKEPINILRDQTKYVIAELLNPKKIFTSSTGLLRDWRGLAELCCIPMEHLLNFELDPDPTTKILDQWYERDTDNATIDKLLKYLEEIDRFDVIDDITTLIEDDIEYHKKFPDGFKAKPLNFNGDPHILTVDDVGRVCQGLQPQIYDAFVLFADDDIDFATELVLKMENDYSLRFCVKDRDLAGGGTELDTIMKLIAERCNKFIPIITPAFLQSSVNSFFYSFAEFIGIQQREIKIIPIIYKECQYLPYELHSYYKLDWRRLQKLLNVWDKLNESIVGSEKDIPCRKAGSRKCNQQTVANNVELKTKAGNIESLSRTSKQHGSFYGKIRKIIRPGKNSAKLRDGDTIKEDHLENTVVELSEKKKFWNLKKSKKKRVAIPS